MNTQQIARHLLNRRNAMNPVLLPGEMIGSLGSDAMQEALQKRWLVPNNESGMLQISQEMGKVQEMRDVADKCPTCNKVECKCIPETAPVACHGYAFEHAMRRPGSGSPLQELLSPGTGHQNDNGLKAPAAPGAPVPPTPLTPSTPPAQRLGGDGKPIGVASAKDGKLQIDLDKTDPATASVAGQLAVQK